MQESVLLSNEWVGKIFAKKNGVQARRKHGLCVQKGYVILRHNGDIVGELVDWAETEADADKKVAAMYAARKAKEDECED